MTLRGCFVTAIGTDIGKTIVSAMLVEALGWAYWKPVQCGRLELSDSDRIRDLVPRAKVYPEAYRFALPASPHTAASAAGATIDLASLHLPAPETLAWSARAATCGRPEVVVDRPTSAQQTPVGSISPTVVEGAGGVMVPLNYRHLMIDLMAHLALPVVVVTRSYLGSINHTLLTLQALRARGLEIAGLVFVGTVDLSSDGAIVEHSGVSELARIPLVETVDRGFIVDQAAQLRGLRDVFH